MKNEISMQDYINYMDSYDEGKNDTEVVVSETPTKSKKPINRHARQKKAFFKSRNRMEKLICVTGWEPEEEIKDVVQGILRSHQLPLDSRCEMTFGCSRGNKRRLDVAEEKYVESKFEIEEEVEIV